MKRPSPLWRSLLYVPVNKPRFIEKAARSGADAIQLDLEDSIAPDEKESARQLVRDAARKLVTAADIVVRINRPLSLAVRDIEAAVCPEVSALSLPKVESADHVKLLAEVISHAELAAKMEIGVTRLILGIESARAWLRMGEIARADDRVVAMLLGSEDFAHSVGMATDPDALLLPKQQMVIAAAAAGIMPLGIVGSFANYRDLDGFRAMVARSAKLGFRGSSCVHPDQVPLLNEGFSPSAATIGHARDLVAAFDQGLSVGQGAVGIDGQMLDLPIVERARAVLALAERLEIRSN